MPGPRSSKISSVINATAADSSGQPRERCLRASSAAANRVGGQSRSVSTPWSASGLSALVARVPPACPTPRPPPLSAIRTDRPIAARISFHCVGGSTMVIPSSGRVPATGAATSAASLDRLPRNRMSDQHRGTTTHADGDEARQRGECPGCVLATVESAGDRCCLVERQRQRAAVDSYRLPGQILQPARHRRVKVTVRASVQLVGGLRLCDGGQQRLDRRLEGRPVEREREVILVAGRPAGLTSNRLPWNCAIGCFARFSAVDEAVSRLPPSLLPRVPRARSPIGSRCRSAGPHSVVVMRVSPGRPRSSAGRSRLARAGHAGGRPQAVTGGPVDDEGRAEVHVGRRREHD